MSDVIDRPVSRRPAAPRRRMSWVLRIGLALATLVALAIVAGFLFVGNYTVPTSSMQNAIMAGDRILVLRGDNEPARGKVVTFRYPGDRDAIEAPELAYYLLRCIAIAGDTVEVRETRAFVNGRPEPDTATISVEPIPASPADQFRTFPVGAGYTGRAWGPMRVPKKGDRIALTPQTAQGWTTLVAREGHRVEIDGATIRIDGAAASSYTVERDYFFALGDNRNNSEDSRYWGFVPYDNTAGRAWLVLASEHPGRTFHEIH
jgi:signal peptidase I